MDKLNLAQEIVVLRGKKGWTQQQLADEVKTTPRTVAAWESGASIPRKAMKVRIAQAFGLAEDYFWDEEELNPVTKKDTPKADMMRRLEKLMSDSNSDITEEQKNLCLQACQDILRMK